MKKSTTTQLVESGMMIALATILSFLKLFQLPYGGTVTILSMLPMILLSYRYGVKWGVLASFAYSLIQLMQGLSEGSLKGISLGAVLGVILFDYICAFTSLGLGGIFKGKFRHPAKEFALGALLACLVRYCCHIISGFLFFGDYAEWFFVEAGFPGGAEIFGMFTGKLLAFVYSVIYNATFMIPETIITVIMAYCIAKINGKLLLTIRDKK